MGDTLLFEYEFGTWHILKKSVYIFLSHVEYGREIIICLFVQTDERHRYLWHKLAEAIGSDENAVEDQLLTDDRWDYIEKFFQVRKSVTLFHLFQINSSTVMKNGSQNILQ